MTSRSKREISGPNPTISFKRSMLNPIQSTQRLAVSRSIRCGLIKPSGGFGTSATKASAEVLIFTTNIKNPAGYFHVEMSLKLSRGHGSGPACARERRFFDGQIIQLRMPPRTEAIDQKADQVADDDDGADLHGVGSLAHYVHNRMDRNKQGYQARHKADD